jgi:ABC-2 type transport system permease protein
MMPLSMLPESVRRFAVLLPPTHAMQAYLGLAFDEQAVIDPLASVVILLASGLLAFGLAIYLFNWDNQHRARRRHPLLALLALVPYVVAIMLVR